MEEFLLLKMIFFEDNFEIFGLFLGYYGVILRLHKLCPILPFSQKRGVSRYIAGSSFELIRAQIVVALTYSQEYFGIAVDNDNDGKHEAKGNSKDEV